MAINPLITFRQHPGVAETNTLPLIMQGAKLPPRNTASQGFWDQKGLTVKLLDEAIGVRCKISHVLLQLIAEYTTFWMPSSRVLFDRLTPFTLNRDPISGIFYDFAGNVYDPSNRSVSKLTDVCRMEFVYTKQLFKTGPTTYVILNHENLLRITVTDMTPIEPIETYVKSMEYDRENDRFLLRREPINFTESGDFHELKVFDRDFKLIASIKEPCVRSNYLQLRSINATTIFVIGKKKGTEYKLTGASLTRGKTWRLADNTSWLLNGPHSLSFRKKGSNRAGIRIQALNESGEMVLPNTEEYGPVMAGNFGGQGIAITSDNNEWTLHGWDFETHRGGAILQFKANNLRDLWIDRDRFFLYTSDGYGIITEHSFKDKISVEEVPPPPLPPSPLRAARA